MNIAKAPLAPRASLRVLLAVAASVALLSPAVAQSNDPTAGLSKWPKEDLAAAEAFARRFLDDLASDEPERAMAALDTSAMLDKAFDGIGTAQTRKAMKDGAKASLGKSLLGTFTTAGLGTRRYKRLVVVDGTLRARFRFFGEQGIVILDLDLARRGDGFVFQDVHNLTLGVSSVQEMRAMASLMYAKLSPGLLARMLGAESLSTEDSDNMVAMMQSVQGADFAKAKQLHDKLPKALRETSIVTALHLQMLAAGSDENAYATALEAAAAKFPAPKFRMTLVDAHILRKRWSAAVRCLDEAMQGIERDAMLLMIRANVQMQGGDIAAARKSTAEALALEPDSDEILVRSLDVLLAAKDWPAVVKTIETLEKSGGYDFKGHIDGEPWAEFRKQPAAKPWL